MYMYIERYSAMIQINVARVDITVCKFAYHPFEGHRIVHSHSETSPTQKLKLMGVNSARGQKNSTIYHTT